MQEFYTYLRSIGINEGPDAVNIVGAMDGPALEALVDRLYRLIPDTIRLNVESAFMFSTGSHISAGPNSCLGLPCRINRAYELAIYASMYADAVYVPNFFEHYLANEAYRHQHKRVSLFRSVRALPRLKQSISGDLIVYLLYKPLLISGAMAIKSSPRTYCIQCIYEEIANEENLPEFKKMEDQIAAALAKSVAFTLKDDQGKPYIEIYDESNYFPIHGYGFSKWSEELLPYKSKLPYRFTQEEAKDMQLALHPARTCYSDMLMQNYAYEIPGAAYLTNLRTDALAIAFLSHEDEAVAPISPEVLQYSVPFIRDADLAQLVNFRLKHEESFYAYREALANVAEEATKDQASAQEMVRTHVRQNLVKIEQLVKNNSDMLSARRRRLSVTSGLIGIGLYGATKLALGNDLLAAVGGIMGGTLPNINAAAIDQITGLKVPAEARNNNYYFLWEANKKLAK